MAERDTAGDVLAELASSQAGVTLGPTPEQAALSELSDPSASSDPTNSEEASAEREPLAKLVRKGLTWSLGGMLIGRVGTLVTGIILARLLSPNDYGVFAVALVALIFISNLNDLGIEQALVRWPDSIDGVAPTGKTVILASSILQFAVLFAGAPYFAHALGADEATGVVRLLSIGVVINGLFAVPSAVLTRSFRQDLRTAADFAGFVVGVVVTVAMAVAGYGVWSLAWGRLLGNAVNGVLHALFARTHYHYGFDRALARELLSEGIPIAGLTILAVSVLNVDTVVAGRVLGPVLLGFYVLAFNLSSWPVNVFAVAVWRVSVPAFARMQNDLARLSEAFTRSFGLLMAVILPVCILLSVLALPLIRLVYGVKWAAAAPVLSVLAALGALRVALQLMTDVLVAVGRSKRAFVLQAIWLAALVPALVVGAHLGGLTGIAWAHVLVALLVVTPLHLRAIAPLGIRLRALLRASGRPMLAASAAAIAALAGMALANTLGDGDVVTLAIAGMAALVTFAAIMAPVRHSALAAIRG